MKTLSIGRDAGNQIVLNDNFVSRRHAELIISDTGQVLIKDLGSSNGTFVNGNRIKECYLNSQDIVNCASVSLNWHQYAVKSRLNTDKPFIISPPPANEAFSRPISSIDKPLNPQSIPQVIPPFPQNQQPNYPQAIQQNVIVMGKAKSVGVAFILAFFFGPLGLLYSSVVGGIVMLILMIPLIILTAGIALIFINLICCVWAVVASNQANEALHNRAAGLINNNFQR